VAFAVARDLSPEKEARWFMNFYDEFFSTISLLNKLGIRYAVVGGVALAFHGRPRFTRDIDLLVHQGDMNLLNMAMGRLSYEETAEPWELAGTTLVLHRFLKIHGQEEFMIDVLVAISDEHFRIIQDALPAESAMGVAPVAARRDIIWMKKSRDSDQDRVDIAGLEENDED
jgi:hypothetical protein